MDKTWGELAKEIRVKVGQGLEDSLFDFSPTYSPRGLSHFLGNSLLVCANLEKNSQEIEELLLFWTQRAPKILSGTIFTQYIFLQFTLFIPPSLSLTSLFILYTFKKRIDVNLRMVQSRKQDFWSLATMRYILDCYFYNSCRVKWGYFGILQ